MDDKLKARSQLEIRAKPLRGWMFWGGWLALGLSLMIFLMVGMLAGQGALEHAERFADADLADCGEDRFLVLEIGIEERFGYAEPLRNVVESTTAVTALVEQMARNLDDAIGLERREFVLDRRFRRFAGHALILC